MKEKILSVCLSCEQFLVVLREVESSTCLPCITIFPPNIKISSHNNFPEREDEEIHTCLSQILEHGFTTK